jgi:hypothetical protein
MRNGDSISPPSARHRMRPTSRLNGGGRAGHVEARRSSFAVNRVDRQSVLHVQMMGGADPVQKLKRVAIAAEKYVLAVVHASPPSQDR